MNIKKRLIFGLSIIIVVVIVLFVVALGTMLRSSGKSMLDTNSFELSDSLSNSRNQVQVSSTGSSNGYNKPSAEHSAFDTMIFENYGTNVFVSPAQDPYSTFGLDVDTASYTMAKNYLLRGELPPKDAIRPEEFINYFTYNYPKPINQDFAIQSTIAHSPFGDNVYLMTIGIKAKEPTVTGPAKLTLVVDVSGSMSTENRIGLVKKSLHYLVNQLDEGDQVAIVKYNTEAKVMLNYTDVSDNETITTVIDALRPSGSTNVEDGLLTGYKVALQGYDASAENRVVLVSDGVANVGETGPDELISKLQSYTEEGITLTAVGFGMGNYNDKLMEQIADGVNGNYAYSNDFSETERIFGKQLLGTIFTVAKNAKLQVEFSPSTVKRYRLVGYENRALADNDFRNDSVDAGEIGIGHEVTAIYELELVSPNLNSEDSIANVSVRYDDVSSGEQKEFNYFINKENLYTSFSQTPESYKLAVIAARFAQVLKSSQPPLQIVDVSALLNSLPANTDARKEFIQIVTNAKRLIELQKS